MHIEHATPMPLRTGYERVMAYRTDDLYAKMATGNGVVVTKNNKSITVKYDDETIVRYELGRRYGTWAGKIVPHDIKTNLSSGDRVKAGDNIIYNANYFSMDKLVPNAPIFKISTLARVALWESMETWEDSSGITASLAKRLETKASHKRSIRIDFNQEIKDLVSVGKVVEADDIICAIYNPLEGNQSLFGDQSLSILQRITNLNPKAKYHGLVERIEVIYTGDPNEMSDSIRALVDESDESRYRLAKQLGKTPVDGTVPEGYRLDGVPMDKNQVGIIVYITSDVSMGEGDKVVFGHQMKSIVSRILLGKQETEDGIPIDAVFSYDSMARRVVLSAELMGTTNSLLKHVSKLAIQAYES